MYQPSVFREQDRIRVYDLIEAHPFGALIVSGPGGELEISHLPFVLDRDAGPHGRLRVHVARANPIWKAALSGGRVTAVFAGPHGYVSPTWYEQPSEQVPTWNYAVVHAHGMAKVMDRDDLIKLLDDLVSNNEGDASDAWRASLLAPAFRNKRLLEIVGLSIEIAKFEGKFKLSQNRSPADRARVVAALRKRSTPEDVELVELMSPRK